MYEVEDDLIQVEIANLQEDAEVDEDLLCKAARYIIEEEKVPEAEISIALLSENEMRRLNREYRGINEPTDVLSFLLDENPLVGELILSPSCVKRQARECGVSFERELVTLTFHGILHLLGYNHEGEEKEAELMWERQKELERDFWMQENIS